MKVYRVEMKQSGTWKIARAPFGSLHGNRRTKEQAILDVENLKGRWASNIIFKERYPEQIPTDWRIMEREESEWTVSE